LVENASHHRLYTQAICTIALCELYGMSGDSRFREPAARSIAYAVKIQAEEGGWKYIPGSLSDTSVTGWFVMALQSARMAKLEVPQQTLDRISAYLDKVQANGGRQYAYELTAPGNITPALSAEGLLCRQYLGWERNDPRLLEGVSALNQMPIVFGADRDVYYWYYATQATHHMGGAIWADWDQELQGQLPPNQVKTGREAGSWEPGGDRWGYVSRLYVTCLSIYCLEVYWRHMPIYGFQPHEPTPAAAAAPAK
jgi:hypothetical protein